MPSDAMYIPLYVGAEGKKDSDGNELDLGYIKDNTGENISILNPVSYTHLDVYKRQILQSIDK